MFLQRQNYHEKEGLTHDFLELDLKSTQLPIRNYFLLWAGDMAHWFNHIYSPSIPNIENSFLLRTEMLFFLQLLSQLLDLFMPGCWIDVGL
jgi:hypothetical protein